MRNSPACAALAILCFAVMPTVGKAQTFEKKNYNYSEWTKGRFSEAVTVMGPGKMVFLAGVGAEDENGKGGDILHKGDFMAQCQYAFDKIKRALEKNGAALGDSECPVLC
jgi:enamine deaminase RidA (YjgF/YER057c/UK114 family)